MFSSSTAARRPTGGSITVTLVVRTLKLGESFLRRRRLKKTATDFQRPRFNDDFG